MKTIVVATDFSVSANQAAHFAAQLARDQHASLILVHAFHFWPANPADSGLDFALSVHVMHDDSNQALRKLAHDLHEQYGEELPIRCITREGYAIPALREVSEQEKADLLVMSTVGSAPQSAQLMGSVATEMIAETAVPLLLLPPSSTYAAIKNVVLGLDLASPPDAVVLDSVLRYVRQFGSVVNVLCIQNDPVDEQTHTRAEHIRRLMSTVPHTLTILPEAVVYEALLRFSHENKADLLMMMPQSHGWFRRLLMGSNTERTARLADIPLLAVV